MSETRASLSASTRGEKHVQKAPDDKGFDLVLEPGAGERLASALDEQIEKTDEWMRRAQGMAEPIPFGANVVAEAMAAKFRGRAEGGPESLTDALRKYRDALRQAKEAVQDAMRDYAQTQQERAESFRQVARDGGLDDTTARRVRRATPGAQS